MGTSKIIMLSGLYTILGVYLVSFNSLDSTVFDTAVASYSNTKAEQLARTGISLALTKMAANSSMTEFSTLTLTTMGGSVSYEASHPVSFPVTQSQIVAVGTFNGKSVTMTAVFHYYGGRWKIARIYTKTA